MTHPDPARSPAGTRVLVEASVQDNGWLAIPDHDGKPLSFLTHPELVVVHGTVAELEQLQAGIGGAEALLTAHGYELRLICDELEIPMPEMNADPILAAIAALRIERDNLAANNARLRQERDEYADGQKRALRDREAVEAEMDRRLIKSWQKRDALRAEVTRIAADLTDEAARGYFSGTFEYHARQLRAALVAQQAPQPATMAAEPLSGAGVYEAMHGGSDGSVGHDRAERPIAEWERELLEKEQRTHDRLRSLIADRWRQLPAGLNLPWLAAGHKPRAAQIGEWVAEQIEAGEPWL